MDLRVFMLTGRSAGFLKRKLKVTKRLSNTGVHEIESMGEVINELSSHLIPTSTVIPMNNKTQKTRMQMTRILSL